MRKLVKILHTVGSCAMVGALLGSVILIAFAPREAPEAFASMRQSIAALSEYVLLPSMGVVMVSGLLSMVVHTPYMDKAWAWMKAASGILVLKGVLHLVAAHNDYAAMITDKVAEGATLTPALRGGAVSHEVGLLWVMLGIALANIVLGIWRPRLDRRRAGQEPRSNGAPTTPVRGMAKEPSGD